MTQTDTSSIYPIVEWLPVEGLAYQGMPVYRHPGNGELAYDEGSCLLGLPAAVEATIRDLAKGKSG